MNQRKLLQIMAGEDRSLCASAIRTGLSLLSPAYRMGVAMRNAKFDRGQRQPANLGRPTISVGNITTGGTGKTPMVIELVHRLVDQGHRPAVLLRGYGSDEVLELRAALTDLPGDDEPYTAPVEPNPDRAAGAAAVLQAHPNTTVFVLDDGFQHRQAHRDLDIVLIDATAPFGYGHLLPRGLLREPVENLRRADAIIITRADQVSLDALADLDARITELAGKPALASASSVWASLHTTDGQTIAITELAGQRVVGICGIGNPAAFERMLRDTAGEVLRCEAADDHHAWTQAELAGRINAAAADGADAVVTTEKDWVKWQPLLADWDLPVPVLRPQLAVAFLDGGDAVDTLLTQTLA